ncbi:MAG TPA: chemotaxis protein CheW [Thermoplasmata archaeon]|nr:chemotaxis protein CheW [Thermoplasmata archaeon]
MGRGSSDGKSLVIRAGPILCAVPLHSVSETMRPLPTEPLSGMPPFVKGISVIRGTPTPVVDLNVVLGNSAEARPRRYVLLRLKGRPVAIAVTEVLGVEDLGNRPLADPPPLLGSVTRELIEAIGVLDAELLAVLKGSFAIPEEAWGVQIDEGRRP